MGQNPDPIRRADGYAKIAAAAFAVGVVAVYVAALGPAKVDFLSFWSAARLVWEGRAVQAWDAEAMRAFQAAAGSASYYPFAYPPPYLLLVAPFGLAPYAVSLALWIGLGLAAYFAIARRLLPEGPWLIAAFPAVFINAVNGQNGFISACLLLGGLMLLDKRPWLAGALLGALIVKPQLALLIPVALVAGGRWRAIAGAAVSSVGLLVLAELLFPGSLQAFLSGSAFGESMLDKPALLRKVHSVFAAVLMAGAPFIVAAVVQMVCTAGVTALVWRVWRGPGETLWKGAVLAAATPLATPYVFDYDLVFLILPLVFVARTRPRLAGALYVALLFMRGIAGLTGISLAPVMLLTLLWTSWQLPRGPAVWQGRARHGDDDDPAR